MLFSHLVMSDFCDPMYCSPPGFPVLYCLPEFAQTPVYWVDAFQPSNLSSPSPHALPQSFPASGSFPVSRLFISGGQSIGASAFASVLPMNIQGWFPLGLTGLFSLLSRGLSRVFSSTTVWYILINKSINQKDRVVININTEKNPKTYEAGIDLREERDASTVAVGDFNTSLPKVKKNI